MKLSEKENAGTENGLKINKTQAIKAFVIVNNIINSKLKKKFLIFYEVKKLILNLILS